MGKTLKKTSLPPEKTLKKTFPFLKRMLLRKISLPLKKMLPFLKKMLLKKISLLKRMPLKKTLLSQAALVPQVSSLPNLPAPWTLSLPDPLDPSVLVPLALSALDLLLILSLLVLLMILSEELKKISLLALLATHSVEMRTTALVLMVEMKTTVLVDSPMVVNSIELD